MKRKGYEMPSPCSKELALKIVPSVSPDVDWLWMLELRFVIERVISDALIGEREMCARIAEKRGGAEIAAAIRARGE